MGKGSNTTSTQQQSTYNPAGAGYITNALNTAQNAAATPFQQQAAPVAGFSQDQQNAFNTVNGAQGMAQPYINTAANYFSPQGTQAFLNPYASNVMAGLQDVFGQQASQQQGQLTQAAGGVGADRIAVGQSELAKQQGLAAGQTLSGLYNNATQQAQSAGYGTAALGSQAQNAALQGAQAQLGTGGLQQQLSQAQLNSPYQLQLAKLAYPFQTSQFLSGAVGSLAGGLGGTTSGQGTTTGPSPSMLSQILGLGTAAAGAAGGAGAFGGGGKGASYGGGNMFSGDAYGGSSSNPLSGLTAADYGAGYAPGGAVDEDEGANPYRLPPGFNDKPINVDQQSIIPTGQIPAIKANIPQINLNSPKQSSDSSGGLGGLISSGVKLAGMFMEKGGRVDPKKFDGANPYAFADGGSTLDDAQWPYGPVGGPSDVVNPDEPFRMPDQGAVDDWRKSSDAMSFAGNDSAAFPPPRGAHGRSVGAAADDSAPSSAETSNPYSAPSAAPQEGRSSRDTGFAGSPWAALMAAGLATAAGTSPFAMSNIGAGGLQGLKTLEAQRAASQKDETIEQASKRLSQEAKFHEDQYSRMTPYQKAGLEMKQNEQQVEALKPVQIGQNAYGQPIYAKRNLKTGEYEVITLPGQEAPASPTAPTGPASPQATPPAAAVRAAADEAALPVNAAPTEGILPTGTFKSEPPSTTVNSDALADMKPADANMVRAIAEGRQKFLPIGRNNPFNRYIMEKVHEYDSNVDEGAFSRRSRTQNFFAVGTQGGGGQNIASMNTFGQHADELLRLSKELNLGQFTTWNQAKNWMSEHGYTDKETQDKIGAWRVAQKAVADEGAKVFAGSNSALADRESWANMFDASNPASVTRSKLKEVVKLIEGRLNSLTEQYNGGMRTIHDSKDFIRPRTREIFDKIKGEGGGSAEVAPAGGGESPKVGERKQFKQGWGIWNGKSWEPAQ